MKGFKGFQKGHSCSIRRAQKRGFQKGNSVSLDKSRNGSEESIVEPKIRITRSMSNESHKMEGERDYFILPKIGQDLG